MEMESCNKSEGNSENRSGAPLPLSVLRLLVPPLRLVSAAMWQTVQQKVVADYGMLEEFVSTVTAIVPELLTSSQKAQLCLGLRGRLILEVCQLTAPADLSTVQPHLDRMQTLLQTCITEAAGTNTDLPHANFMDLVKNLLLSPDKKEHFFQTVFHEEFGPKYDEELHTLMWLFLSRLEKFLPLHSFQLVASMFEEASCVLEDCLQPVSQCEELKVLLQHHKNLSQLDHSDVSLDGSHIISALKLPSVKKPPDTGSEGSVSHDVQLWEEEANSDCKTTTDEPAREKQTVRGGCSPAGAGTLLCLGGTKRKEKVEHRSQPNNVCHLLKECSVKLQRLDRPPPAAGRPERPNRGQKMKQYLLEHKSRSHRAPEEESAPKPPSSRTAAIAHQETSFGLCQDFLEGAPISPCSDDKSWSYYSDEGSGDEALHSSSSLASSWSYYSSHSSSCSSSLSNSPKHIPLTDPKNVSTNSKKPDVPNKGATIPKKAPEFQCFICKEHVTRSLNTHLKTHFPSGEYTCPQCDIRFKLVGSLIKHMRKTCVEHVGHQVNPENPEEAKDLYKCDKCPAAFSHMVSLQKHTLTHSQLYCHVCQKVLRDAETLERHKASHTAFQCTRCHASFTRFKPLLHHCQNLHHIAPPFQCNTCPKAFRSLRLLIIHEWCHTGQLPFRCAMCSLRFKCAAELAYHERVHTREKPYLCAECGRTFAQKTNMLRHVTVTHKKPACVKRHACSQCHKTFKDKGGLKQHHKTKHLNEYFRSPCPYCGKMLASSTIARHKLIHTGEKPFECPECDQRFRSSAEVKRHGLMHHSTERPYKCDVCNKGFVRMCYLKVHARVHTGEKPYTCPICLKAFPKTYSMLRHKRLVHSFVTQ